MNTIYLRWLSLALIFALVGTTVVLANAKPPRWLVVAAAAGALVLGTDRTTYLPFLGETVLPPSVLNVSSMPPLGPNSKLIDIKAPPRATHLVFWAAEKNAKTPGEAYDTFDNAGVAHVSDGTATISLAEPGQYGVPVRGTLPKHAHYRAVFPNGMLGAVQTVKIT